MYLVGSDALEISIKPYLLDRREDLERDGLEYNEALSPKIPKHFCILVHEIYMFSHLDRGWRGAEIHSGGTI